MAGHQHVAFGVPGFDEEGGQLLKKRLEATPGVHTVTVWQGEQQIDVDYDAAVTSPGAIAYQIQQLGYLAKNMPYQERWPG